MIPYLDIHVFSAVLFIVVGILLTHALWFNWWNSEDEQGAHESVSQLAAELSHQQRKTTEQHEAYQQLRVEYEATQRDWLALRQENEHLKTRDHERQRACSSQDTSLRKLKEFKHEALIGLEQERHRRVTAETGLRSANTTIAQLKSELSAVGDRVAAAPALHEGHQQQAEDHTAERLQREREEFRKKLQDEVRRREELEESVKAKERVITQLAADSQALKSMRAKQATFQATHEADAQRITALQEEVQQLQNDNQTVLAQTESLDKRLEAEQSTIRDHEREKQDLVQELHEQREKTFTLETALAANSHDAKSLEEASHLFAELQSQHESTQTALQEACDQLQSVTADRDQLRKTTDALRDQTRQVQIQLERMETEHEQMQAQHDESLARDTDYQASTRQLNKQLHSLQQSLNQLRQQRDDAGKSARTHRECATALEGQLGMAHERIASFEEQTHLLHKLQTQQEGFQRSLQECAVRLQRAGEERDQKAGELADSRAEVASLRTQLKQLEMVRNQEVHRTEQQLIALRRRRQLANEGATQEAGQPGKTRRDTRLGMLYTEEPELKDDLQQITGITETVEQRLNDFGVYTYRQIMEWDSVAVEEFTRLLGVKDRILGDNWVAESRMLHAQHGDEAA